MPHTKITAARCLSRPTGNTARNWHPLEVAKTCYPIQQVDKTPSAFVFLRASMSFYMVYGISWLAQKRVTENEHAEYHYCVILTRQKHSNNSDCIPERLLSRNWPT